MRFIVARRQADLPEVVLEKAVDIQRLIPMLAEDKHAALRIIVNRYHRMPVDLFYITKETEQFKTINDLLMQNNLQWVVYSDIKELVAHKRLAELPLDNIRNLWTLSEGARNMLSAGMHPQTVPWKMVKLKDL